MSDFDKEMAGWSIPVGRSAEFEAARDSRKRLVGEFSFTDSESGYSYEIHRRKKPDTTISSGFGDMRYSSNNTKVPSSVIAELLKGYWAPEIIRLEGVMRKIATDG